MSDLKVFISEKELDELAALKALAQRMAQQADEAANLARVCAYALQHRIREIIEAHGYDPADDFMITRRGEIVPKDRPAEANERSDGERPMTKDEEQR